MVRNPDISSVTACLDGVAVALDEGERPPRKSRTQTSYCVQYSVPSDMPHITGRIERFIHVAADNPADAVEAVKAAYPLADILSVG